MGRKAITKNRKKRTGKVDIWLRKLLLELQNKDLDKLTMDDLSKLAGKSKSTIYEYFRSKEEIIEAACETRTDTLTALIMTKLHEDIDTVRLYKDLVQIFAQSNEGITISFLQNIKQYYPKAWAIVDAFVDSFVEILKAHYVKGMEEGIYNKFSVELMGHIDKLFVLEVVTNRKLFSDRTYTLSDLVKEYLNLRLIGILKPNIS